jgi:hypothetical protein
VTKMLGTESHSSANFYQRQGENVVSGERLIMSQMVLVNFKSYAGKVVIGPFHKVVKVNLVFYFNCRAKRIWKVKCD